MSKDNELIAEFMGLPLTKVQPQFTDGAPDKTVPFMHWKYDTSWDWLMPVVEKIEAMHLLVEMVRNQCTISHEGAIDDEYPWLYKFEDINTSFKATRRRTKESKSYILSGSS